MAATAAQPDQHPWLSRFFTEHVWATHLIAACSAGAVADVVVNPLFVVRTRMQTQHMRLLHGGADSGVLPLASEGPSTSSSSARPQQQQLYTTTRATLVRLVREEGWLSLLRGVSASFLGLTHVAVQFPLYEQFKTSLLQAKIDEMTKSSDGSSGAASSAAAAVRGAPAQEPPCLSMMELIGASALSKVLASSLTFPHEVLRARMQHAPMAVFSSLRDCARKTVRLEGWKALYKGFGVNLVRTVPGAALTLVSYEMILDCLTHAYPSRAKQPC
jgi:solute carrier family 25 folate transporter 32